jgi:hypothetical protein
MVEGRSSDTKDKAAATDCDRDVLLIWAKCTPFCLSLIITIKLMRIELVGKSVLRQSVGALPLE